jgi:hypothetical protein
VKKQLGNSHRVAQEDPPHRHPAPGAHCRPSELAHQPPARRVNGRMSSLAKTGTRNGGSIPSYPGRTLLLKPGGSSNVRLPETAR